MIDELTKIKYRIETLNKTKAYNLAKSNELNTQLSELTKDLTFVVEAREYYRKAVDIIYERSIVELKDILNSALSYIFYDENYSVEIELTDKRGKSLSIRLFLDGKPVNLKRGTGMGIKTVISAVLHMYYLQCKNSHVLMLDEAYSAVSVEYIDRFFEFLHQMCAKLGFKIILITHDERFLKYGDKRYLIDKGVVSEDM